MTKTLVCLKGTFEALPVVQRVKNMGYGVVLVDADADSVCRPWADVFVRADHYSAVDTLRGLAGVTLPALDGVLCCCGDTPHVAAAVAHAFDLPGLTPAQAALSVDKVRQKMVLSLAGLTVPDFIHLNGVDYNDMARALDVMLIDWDGVVIKPTDSRGARGVVFVLESTDIPETIRQAQALDSHGLAMAEEYLDGPQLSTESVVADGRVLFTSIGLRNYERFERAEFGGHPIEDGFDMPYGDAALLAEVNDVLTRACAALGWRTLTVKGDLIVHAGRVVILELAARLSGGFLSTHGTPLAYGVELVNMAIRLALGHTFDAPSSERRRQFVCQRYVFPRPADISKTVIKTKIGYAESRAGVEFATYAVRPGDVIAPVVSHGQRLGQAIAVGSTPDEARARAEAAVAAMYGALVLA
jgi:biotin carboxylase